jgi:hypothetical protein
MVTKSTTYSVNAISTVPPCSQLLDERNQRRCLQFGPRSLDAMKTVERFGSSASSIPYQSPDDNEQNRWLVWQTEISP